MSPPLWSEPELIESRDPADLLTKLDPSSPLWAPFEYGRWAFRGQANVTWDLVPRAFRPGELLSFSDPTLRAKLDRRKQIEAEWTLLAQFVELADELGFRLPGDLGEFRFPWKHHQGLVVLNASWPPTNILEIAAVAQHHGVPTRLLDFTFNPLVAAYFAAASHDHGAERLAVWAVDVKFIRDAWAPFEPGVRIVQVSRGLNPFLHAQNGLFVYDAAERDVPSLRERILKHDVQASAHIGQQAKDQLLRSPRIHCITLSTGYRSSLLDQLVARRVTRAHLQPTLDNVVAQLRISCDESRNNSTVTGRGDR